MAGFMMKEPMRKWLLIFGCWTALVFVFAAQSYLYNSSRGAPPPLKSVLLWAISEWYTWAALSPLILWLARRYRIERRNYRQALLIHLAAGVCFALLQPVIQAWVKFAGLGGDLRPRPYGVIMSQLLYTKIHINII